MTSTLAGPVTVADLLANADQWLESLAGRDLPPDTAVFALYRLCPQLTAALRLLSAPARDTAPGQS